ncbi:MULTISPECIES: hypothetical protein [Jannaschia]|uniref:hypothetical protein n=1 Tax=Jannaschia TaxID=188905 RepID=UPI002105359D|nr:MULTISPECIES: hypothetical protein [unclassified Jannaschia]
MLSKSPITRSFQGASLVRSRRSVWACAAALLLACQLLAAPAGAQDAPPVVDMTLTRMETVLTRLDPALERAGGAFRMTVEDVPVLVITDPTADRMRAMVPIRSAEGLKPEDLTRMMQANFDSALDARYAVAEGRVWAVFIHPLSPLRDDQLVSGIGQTVNTALSYGTLFSSGAGQFGRGDSQKAQRELLERLQRQGRDI